MTHAERYWWQRAPQALQNAEYEWAALEPEFVRRYRHREDRAKTNQLMATADQKPVILTAQD